ncbi:unnamed protein product [Microthlaspi erraticum]|uniref:FLZ-type domain-containing protein n=1 Tax=Microthlaspi erraticum TaxID=1685480 RepID=A0A6D2HIX2_9BRAS|nr:unnamed protein product [Microthlaspi erraticum]
MVVPGNGSTISPRKFTASSRSPLDIKFPLPGSSKRYDNGGVGLGIVAALEKSGIGISRHEISSKQNPVCYYGSGLNRSDPARIQFPAEIDLSEEYTCVTSRDGVTKVYYNDNEFEFCKNPSDGDQRCNKSMDVSEEPPENKKEVFRDSPDFLSSCCLCDKKLQGKDIYMYNGDKGFCSRECRSVQILEDSLNMQYKSRSVEVLSSPNAGGQISSAGIFVI